MDKNKKEKKKIKDLEDELKEHEKVAEQLKGQIFEMKEGLGISKEQYQKVKNDRDKLIEEAEAIDKKIKDQKAKDKGEE